MQTSQEWGLGLLCVIFKVRFPEAKEITVQSMTGIPNDMGETIADWVDVGTIDGEIWALKGTSERNERGVTATSTHKLFTVDAVTSNTRLITPDGMYLVGYVNPLGSHNEAILELIT